MTTDTEKILQEVYATSEVEFDLILNRELADNALAKTFTKSLFSKIAGVMAKELMVWMLISSALPKEMRVPTSRISATLMKLVQVAEAAAQRGAERVTEKSAE